MLSTTKLIVAAFEKMSGEPTLITADTSGGCAHVKVIQDTKEGNWSGACSGLIKQPDVTDTNTCEATCRADLNCTVWRMTNASEGLPQGCFLGSVAHHCRTNTVGGFLGIGDTKPENIVRGQRIQHGEVVVVSDNVGVQTLGLLKMKETSSATGNEKLMVERCKEFCYTDTFCTVWQYGRDGCHIEHIPGHQAEGTTNTSAWAQSMIAGQTIKHVCPTEEPVEEPMDNSYVLAGVLIYIIAGIALVCLGGMIHSILQGKTKKKVSTNEEDEEEEDEDEGDDRKGLIG